MKHNILFISSLDISGNRKESDGVTKKILLQIRTFSELGYNVDYIYRQDSKAFLFHEGEPIFLTNHNGVHYKTMTNVYRSLIKISQTLHYDLVYIRYEGNNIPMWRFLSKIKNDNPETKIIAELPTFMKRWEPGTNLRGKIAFILHKIKDNLYRLPMDYIVTFDNHKRLFGYPTIQIENFADVEALPIKTNSEENGEFHILAMAKMTPSHGFDRILQGLYAYYQKNHNVNVILHLVGNGTILNQWQELTNRLSLNKYVVFHGALHGTVLDQLFDKCNMGAASLAIFRKGCAKASELKIREYTSRGLPFFYSAEEPQIKDQKFCLKVPHDETCIDIQSIIDFYDSINWEKEKYIMHNFAKNNFSCGSQLSRIISYLNLW